LPSTVLTKLDNLKTGMVVAKEVESNYGATFFTPGMIIDAEAIKRLKRLGVKSIVVYQEDIELKQEQLAPISERYEYKIDEMEGIFHSIEKGHKLDFQGVKDIVDELVKIEENEDIYTLLAKIYSADRYTYAHSLNVGLFSMMTGKWLKMPEKEVKLLTYAGFLHDIGKARIPNKILNKAGPLSNKEFNIMKRHTVYGYDLVKNCLFISEKVARAVLTHHERNNGTGYPLGLKGDQIPLYAKIIGIIDTYDAMSSDRIYQSHKVPFEVLDTLRKERDGSLDISLVNLIVEKLIYYFSGRKVELTNGKVGEVIFINPEKPLYPIIKVEGSFYDLYRSDLKIKDVII